MVGERQMVLAVIVLGPEEVALEAWELGQPSYTLVVPVVPESELTFQEFLEFTHAVAVAESMTTLRIIQALTIGWIASLISLLMT
jgi:hypothetical protein